MNDYVFHYIVPVLVVMAVLLVFSAYYKSGARFRRVALVCLGFLLGWISAFSSLHLFGLIR
jgi:hypothetical protein